MKLYIKKVRPAAILPDYANAHDAGMDLYTAESTIIKPGEHSLIPTGISMAIPEGYVGLIWDKSGLAVKHKLVTVAGVIDAGYRGEIQIAIMNTGAMPYVVEAGKKIAQLLVQPILLPTIMEVTELPDSQRGSDGFGSSGLDKKN
jgi:dUTP pyrophosphatase